MCQARLPAGRLDRPAGIGFNSGVGCLGRRRESGVGWPARWTRHPARKVSLASCRPDVVKPCVAICYARLFCWRRRGDRPRGNAGVTFGGKNGGGPAEGVDRKRGGAGEVVSLDVRPGPAGRHGYSTAGFSFPAPTVLHRRNSFPASLTTLGLRQNCQRMSHRRMSGGVLDPPASNRRIDTSWDEEGRTTTVAAQVNIARTKLEDAIRSQRT